MGDRHLDYREWRINALLIPIWWQMVPSSAGRGWL
jgi:hypothetical protein